MIDYETYLRTFGEKDKNSGEYKAGLPKEMFDLFNKPDRFGIAFDNETYLTLMEDVMIAMGSCMLSNDKQSRLASYKKLAGVIKKVLEKADKSDGTVLTDSYYENAPSPDERELFAENPLVTAKGDVTRNISAVLVGLSGFYRAMNTQVGRKVHQKLLGEKRKAIETLFEDKHKNGTSLYYNILGMMLSQWGRRMSMYESYSKRLKLISGGIRDARKSRAGKH